MTDTLHILHGDTPVGRLTYVRRRDEISLSYDESWQFGRESFPIAKAVEPTRDAVSQTNPSPFLHQLADLIAKQAQICAGAME